MERPDRWDRAIDFVGFSGSAWQALWERGQSGLVTVTRRRSGIVGEDVFM